MEHRTQSAIATSSKPSAPSSRVSVDATAQDPPFLKEKVDHYYTQRLAKDCGGVHPMKGKVPGPDSIRLRSNDFYASLDILI